MADIREGKGDTVMVRPDKDTPFKGNTALEVTPEQAAGIKAFLRELKPGIYVKCSECQTMKYGRGNFHFRQGAALCDRCA